MQTKKISPETSYVKAPYATYFNSDLKEYLEQSFMDSPRSRHRLCFHQSPNVEIHDIIITYDASSYIPVNKHIGKSETLCVLQGLIEIFFFNDLGQCYLKQILGSSDSGHPFLTRIPPNTWHGLRVISEEPCVVKETIPGPYSKESLQWADFSPTEEQNKIDGCGREYYRSLSDSTSCSDKKFEYIQTNEVVLQNASQHPFISIKDLDILKTLAQASPLNRARICLHPNPGDIHQDMLIYLGGQCSIPISYHINKDESLVVLEGNGKYEFTKQDGSIAQAINLAPVGSISQEKSCFCRINRFVGHKITPCEDGILIYETTSGPFNKEDTSYEIEYEF